MSIISIPGLLLAQTPEGAVSQGPGAPAPSAPPAGFENSPAVVLLLVLAVLGLVLVSRVRRDRADFVKNKQSALIRQRRETALNDFEQSVAESYPHVLVSPDRDNALCMSADGRKLRVVRIWASAEDTSIDDVITVDVALIVSIELVHHHERFTESTTVEKKKGAIGRAVAGELLFGGVGAIVGAASAGSTAKTTGREHAVYTSSELIFGLSDLHHPVLRFISTDADESDRWLHRVRAAMARVRTVPTS